MPGTSPEARLSQDVVPLIAAGGLTDEAIALRVRSGERALFEILIRRHDQQLFRAARAILGDDGEAEDAVQQAWLLAYSKLGQFSGQAKLSTWLTRIVINEALARRPRLRLLEELEMEPAPPDEASAAPGPEQAAGLRELAHILEQAVDKLPELYRVVFVLREVQGLSTAETAECLGASEDAVKVRLHRAKAQLREVVASRLEDAAPDAWTFLGSRCDRMVALVMSKLG